MGSKRGGRSRKKPGAEKGRGGGGRAGRERGLGRKEAAGKGMGEQKAAATRMRV